MGGKRRRLRKAKHERLAEIVWFRRTIAEREGGTGRSDSIDAFLDYLLARSMFWRPQWRR